MILQTLQYDWSFSRGQVCRFVPWKHKCNLFSGEISQVKAGTGFLIPFSYSEILLSS